jgi:transcriptional regulator with XRE-family HTH domain
MRPSDVIGQRVRLARELAGMSQAALGAALGQYLGKPWAPQQVASLETGKRKRLSPDELVALAGILDRPVTWFLLPEGDEPYRFPGGMELDPRAVLGERASRSRRPAEAERLVRSLERLLPHLLRTWQRLQVASDEAQKELRSASELLEDLKMVPLPSSRKWVTRRLPQLESGREARRPRAGGKR